MNPIPSIQSIYVSGWHGYTSMGYATMNLSYFSGKSKQKHLILATNLNPTKKNKTNTRKRYEMTKMGLPESNPLEIVSATRQGEKCN